MNLTTILSLPLDGEPAKYGMLPIDDAYGNDYVTTSFTG